jgi:NAD(P)-binding Rossmann-like domain
MTGSQKSDRSDFGPLTFLDPVRATLNGSAVPGLVTCASVMLGRRLLLHRLPRSRQISVSCRHAQERLLYNPESIERDADEVDVCIVGAGPAGLSAAIRLKQLEKEKGKEIRVVVLEKGPEVGSFLAFKMHYFWDLKLVSRVPYSLRRCH